MLEATARANNLEETTLSVTYTHTNNDRNAHVLPVPGGPYNNTPFGGLIPTRKNNSGLFNGLCRSPAQSTTCDW